MQKAAKNKVAISNCDLHKMTFLGSTHETGALEKEKVQEVVVRNKISAQFMDLLSISKCRISSIKLNSLECISTGYTYFLA